MFSALVFLPPQIRSRIEYLIRIPIIPLLLLQSNLTHKSGFIGRILMCCDFRGLTFLGPPCIWNYLEYWHAVVLKLSTAALVFLYLLTITIASMRIEWGPAEANFVIDEKIVFGLFCVVSSRVFFTPTNAVSRGRSISAIGCAVY